MPKYDVYRAPKGAGYLLDVQTDLLGDLRSRVVVPLLPRTQNYPIAKRLNPVFVLFDKEHIMVTELLAAVPKQMLTAPQANLSDHFAEITDALDMLFQGF